MLQSISEFFDSTPYGIEIHPGDKRNTLRDLLNSSKKIIVQFEAIFGKKPLILIENRTGQFIENGLNICKFMNLLK